MCFLAAHLSRVTCHMMGWPHRGPEDAGNIFIHLWFCSCCHQNSGDILKRAVFLEYNLNIQYALIKLSLSAGNQIDPPYSILQTPEPPAPSLAVWEPRWSYLELVIISCDLTFLLLMLGHCNSGCGLSRCVSNVWQFSSTILGDWAFEQVVSHWNWENPYFLNKGHLNGVFLFDVNVLLISVWIACEKLINGLVNSRFIKWE